MIFGDVNTFALEISPESSECQDYSLPGDLVYFVQGEAKLGLLNCSLRRVYDDFIEIMQMENHRTSEFAFSVSEEQLISTLRKISDDNRFAQESFENGLMDRLGSRICPIDLRLAGGDIYALAFNNKIRIAGWNEHGTSFLQDVDESSFRTIMHRSTLLLYEMFLRYDEMWGTEDYALISRDHDPEDAASVLSRSIADKDEDRRFGEGKDGYYQFFRKDKDYFCFGGILTLRQLECTDRRVCALLKEPE